MTTHRGRAAPSPALDIECPRCGVARGERCEATHPKHGLLWRPYIAQPHRERIAEAAVPRRSRRRRLLGGVWMTCLSPGNWLSEDGTIAAMHMMQGTPVAMWELYLTQLAKGEVRRVPKNPDTTAFLCADHWCEAFTFGELADDIAKLADWRHNLARNLSLVCERQAQDRAWGFGPPDPALGWYQYQHGQKAIQPRLR